MESKALDQSRNTQRREEEDLSNNSRVLRRRYIGWCVDFAKAETVLRGSKVLI